VDDRGRPGVELELLRQNVLGDGDQYRPHGRLLRQLEGPLEDDRQIVRVNDLSRPLGEDPARAHNVAGEVRIALQEPRVVLAGRHHQRDSPGQRVVQHRRRRCQARPGVQVEEARPAGGSRVALGHARADRFVQTQDVADLGSGL
jgi:hypothetical protein